MTRGPAPRGGSDFLAFLGFGVFCWGLIWLVAHLLTGVAS
jgi:hypothetical protein